GIAVVVTALAATLMYPVSGGATTSPTQDPFYSYTGSTPLQNIAPGTVLKTRTMPYHFLGIPVPLSAIQLLFRTTNAVGQPAVSVTSIVHAAGASPTKLVSYQSFYDSL